MTKAGDERKIGLEEGAGGENGRDCMRDDEQFWQSCFCLLFAWEVCIVSSFFFYFTSSRKFCTVSSALQYHI
jgi:hypothetical protein